MFYDIKLENKKKKKISNWDFLSGIGKNILFGIGNGAEFRSQNRAITSPALKWHFAGVPLMAQH